MDTNDQQLQLGLKLAACTECDSVVEHKPNYHGPGISAILVRHQDDCPAYLRMPELGGQPPQSD